MKREKKQTHLKMSALKHWKTVLCVLLVVALAVVPIVGSGAGAADATPQMLDLSGMTVSAKSQDARWAPVTNLIDGDLTKAYNSAGGYSAATHPTVDEWVILNMGQLYTVNQLNFIGKNTGNYHSLPDIYTISVSKTGEDDSWTTVYTCDALSIRGGDADGYSRYVNTFDAVDAQYIKLHVTKLQTQSTTFELSLRELEVYGVQKVVEDEPTAAPTEAPTAAPTQAPTVAPSEAPTEAPTAPVGNKIDLTADGTSVSSEQAGGSNIKLTDDITSEWNSRWVSQAYAGLTGMAEWVKTDLGGIYEVDQVAFYSVTTDGRAMPTAFEIRTSEDGVTWTTAHTETAYAPNGTIAHSFTFTAVKARYVQLYVTASYAPWSATANYVSLVELEAYGTPWIAPTSEKIPLTADKTTLSGDQSNNGATKLTDGVTSEWNSRWSSNTYSTLTDMDEWVEFELGAIYQVDKLAFYSVTTDGRAMPTAFTIQTSMDGRTWTTVHTQTAYAPNGTIVHTFEFDAVKARFVRLNVSAIYAAWNATTNYVSLVEIDVYGIEQSAEEPLPKLDLVADQVSLSSDIALGGAVKLSDGITNEWNSRWCSNTYESTSDMIEWIQIDLGTVHELDKLAFYSVTTDGRAMPTDFEIQTSMDGEKWTTLVEKTAYAPNGTVSHEFSFYRTEAKLVRLYITAIHSGWNATTNYVSLVELELYGQDTGKQPPLSADKIVIGEDGRLHYDAYLNGLTGNYGIPNWDPHSQLIQASKSLEVGWATGYGKGFLIDNIAKGDNPPTQGMYASIDLGADGISLVGANETQDVNEYIVLNLLDSFTIDTFGFATYLKGSNRGMPEDFTIDVSDDGVSWNTVYTATAFPAQSGKLWYFVEFTPVECQYVRLHVTKVGDIIDDNLQYSVMLTEIAAYLCGEEYIEPIVPQPEPLPDLVVVHEDGRIDLSAYLEGRNDYLTMPNWDIDNQVISASKSLEVPWMPGYGKGFLIDGIALGDDYPVNHGVFLTAGFNGRDYVGLNTTNDVDEWVIMNLQKPFTIDRVDLGAYRYGDEYGFPSDFEILVSSDGMTWETVLTVEDYFVPFNKTLHTFTFDAVECQYVQIRVSRICDWFDPAIQYALTLSEMIVYEAGHED